MREPVSKCHTAIPLIIVETPNALQSHRHGHWTLDIGRWTLDVGRWTLDVEHRTLDIERWTLDDGHWTLDIGRWTLDAGHWTLDIGRWTLDVGVDDEDCIDGSATRSFPYERFPDSLAAGTCPSNGFVTVGRHINHYGRGLARDT